MRTIKQLIADIEAAHASDNAEVLAKQMALQIALSGLVREEWDKILAQIRSLIGGGSSS